MGSSDNPQFEPQPVVSAEPAPIAVDLGVGPPVTQLPEVARLARDPVWSGWDVLLITLLTVGTVIVVESLVAVGLWGFVYQHSSLVDVLRKPVVALAGQFLSYIVVALVMVMFVEGKYRAPFWQAIRWSWPSSNMKLMGLLLIGMLTVALDILSRFLPMPKTSPFDEFFAHPREAYLTAAFAVTLGPLIEELLFRGFLYPVLARRTGAVAAVVLTALPFGLIHYLQYQSWSAVLVVGLVGVVLAVVRAVTKSVAASFLVHVGYNGTLMCLMALQTDGFRHMPKAFACFRLP